MGATVSLSPSLLLAIFGIFNILLVKYGLVNLGEIVMKLIRNMSLSKNILFCARTIRVCWIVDLSFGGLGWLKDFLVFVLIQ
jgi:hypothetical protein